MSKPFTSSDEKQSSLRLSSRRWDGQIPAFSEDETVPVSRRPHFAAVPHAGASFGAGRAVPHSPEHDAIGIGPALDVDTRVVAGGGTPIFVMDSLEGEAEAHFEEPGFVRVPGGLGLRAKLVRRWRG